MRWWPEPTAGEIVWCHFPDNIHPNPNHAQVSLFRPRKMTKA